MSKDINQAEEQGAFYDAALNTGQRIWQDYNNYLTFVVPFIFFRALTPFKPGETIATRLLEGSAFAALAAGVEYGVTHNHLNDYSLSQLPVIASFLYSQNPLGASKSVSLAVAVAGTAISAYAFQTANLPLVAIPIVTFTACRLNNVPKELSSGLTVAATAMDLFLNYNEHYATWGIIGGAIAHNIASMHPRLTLYETKYKALTAIGAAAALKLASFEPLILDQLFTPSHFQESYNSIMQFVDHDNFTLALQKHMITGTNIQLCLGYFGNYLTIGKQMSDNKLVAIGSAEDLQKVTAFQDFTYVAMIVIIKYLLPYMAVKLLSEILIANNNQHVINLVENEFLEKNLLIKDNFIQAAKSNYTTQSYLKDITTIADDLKTIHSSVFGLPKIVQIGDKLNLITSAGLGAVVLIDVVIQDVITRVTELMQFYEDQRTKCDSAFDRVTSYDKENAITISQKDGLSYSLVAWDNLQQCKQANLLQETILDRLIDVGQFFYIDYALYTGLHILVGYLNMKGAIKVDELFLYTRSLELTSEAILFKSKNIAGHTKIESAVARLNELAEFLNSNENSIAKVGYKVDLNNNTLSIVNLDFTRGNKEQIAHLHIDDLKLSMGKIYAVTGSNGSGKSSFTTLLKYVFDHIADPSFNVTDGNIVYPSDKVVMIPQKDYIPYNSTLLELITYPDKISNLTRADENKIVALINGLQVFGNNVTETDLYQLKDNWNSLSGGQKKKLFMVKPFIECPKVLIMDETFGPLDPPARSVLMNKIDNSCLNETLILIVWHQDHNKDGTTCVKDTFFDYELHIQNETFVLGQVGTDCLNY